MPGPVFIDGDRVELRTVEEEDLDFLQELINDPAIRRSLVNRSPINGQQEQEWFEESASAEDYDDVDLLICRDGDAVGSVGLHGHDPLGVSCEIGIFLAEEHWSEGYGTAASRLVTDYAFRERRIHRVIAHVIDGNDGSQRIWKKLGFRQEATHVEATFIDGEYDGSVLQLRVEIDPGGGHVVASCPNARIVRTCGQSAGLNPPDERANCAGMCGGRQRDAPGPDAVSSKGDR